MAYTVVTASDSRLILAGIRLLLSPSREFQIVGESDHSPALLELVRHQSPDLLIVELASSSYLTAELVRYCRREATPPKVLLLEGSQGDLDPDTVRICRACGYFSKSCEPFRFLEACRTVCQGLPWNLPAPQPPPPYPVELACLTRRERLILSEVVTGRTNLQISRRLLLSTCTVRNAVSRIFQKLDANNRTHLIQKYMLAFARDPLRGSSASAIPGEPSRQPQDRGGPGSSK